MNICTLIHRFDKIPFVEKKEYFLGELLTIKGDVYISIGDRSYAYYNTIVICDLIEIYNSINVLIYNNYKRVNINIYSYPEIEMYKCIDGSINVIHRETQFEFKISSVDALSGIAESVKNMILDFVRREIPNLEDLVNSSFARGSSGKFPGHYTN